MSIARAERMPTFSESNLSIAGWSFPIDGFISLLHEASWAKLMMTYTDECERIINMTAIDVVPDKLQLSHLPRET